MLINPKYQIVLFKDKVKKKIIKKFNNFKNTENYFKKLLSESNDVIFPKKIEGSKICKFEIGILQDGLKTDIPQYTIDELGRYVKIQLLDEQWGIIKISLYNQEEKIYDIKTGKKISSKELISKYIKGDSLKLINSLHNKVIVQKDDEFLFFSLKSSEESNRFLDCLVDYFSQIKRNDCLIVKDTSSAQKKYLFDLLSSKGFDKKFLYRKHTTFPQ